MPAGRKQSISQGGHHENEIQVSYRAFRWCCPRWRSYSATASTNEATNLITDAEAYKAVLAPASAMASGGSFVIRTDKITSLDGTPPARFVLIKFDSVEQAQAWHNSAAQKEVDAIRAKSTDSLAFIVEGMAK